MLTCLWRFAFLLVLHVAAKDCSHGVCKKAFGNNWARWPEDAPDDATYPLVAFAHGMATTVSGNYASLVDHIVGQGFVVVAPNTCTLGAYCKDFGKDLLAAMSDALELKQGSSAPSWTKLIDESATAVVGHSMGGAATLKMAGGKYGDVPKLKAVVALHPACEVPNKHAADCKTLQSSNKKIDVPTFYGITPYDAFVADGAVWDYHEDVKASTTKPSLYALMSCSTALTCNGHAMANSHLVATDQGGALWNEHVGRFLTCYVKGEKCSDWPMHPCPPALPSFGAKLSNYGVRPCESTMEV